MEGREGGNSAPGVGSPPALPCSLGPVTAGTVAASVKQRHPSLRPVTFPLCNSPVELSCVFPSAPTLGKQRDMSSYGTRHSRAPCDVAVVIAGLRAGGQGGNNRSFRGQCSEGRSQRTQAPGILFTFRTAEARIVEKY